MQPMKQNGQKLFDAVMAAQKAMPPKRKRKRPSRNALRVPPRPTGATITGAVQSSDRVGY